MWKMSIFYADKFYLTEIEYNLTRKDNKKNSLYIYTQSCIAYCTTSIVIMMKKFTRGWTGGYVSECQHWEVGGGVYQYGDSVWWGGGVEV